MKKMLLAAFMLVSISAFTQKFQVDVKAGINISNFVGVNFKDAATKSASSSLFSITTCTSEEMGPREF